MVLHGVDLEVPEGGALAVLGRNGVGKTTLIHTLMGMVRPRSGSVRLVGRELAGSRTDAIAKAGVAIVPQGRGLFGPLTVQKHLALCIARAPDGPLVARARPRAVPAARSTSRPPGITPLGRRAADARDQLALLANPALLLLDEPSDGLAPGIVRQIEQILREVRDEGVGVVLVEQDLRLAFGVAGDVCVLDKGRFVHRTTSQRSAAITTRRGGPSGSIDVRGEHAAVSAFTEVRARAHEVYAFAISPGLVRTEMDRGVAERLRWNSPELAAQLVELLAFGRGARSQAASSTPSTTTIEEQIAGAGEVVERSLNVMRMRRLGP